MSISANRSISRLLVANRGEIALRVMRACREIEILTIAVYGEGEEFAPHVRYADEAYCLKPGSGLPYLDIAAILAAASKTRADAVHPGYGFLSENAAFAQGVIDHGMIFVGPLAETIAAMGDKVEARKIAQDAGLSPVPGTREPVASVSEARARANSIGYPIAVKAVGGGGGRGFRVARDESGLADAFTGSSGEAERYFANPDVYLERYLEDPRHIEVQVFGDSHGTVVALGERDCSIQRRHQKLVEESPSPAVDAELRQRLSEATVALARSVGYLGAGTVEYLLDGNGDFYFLEMNTRIQVEHTVTEMVTGIDLVREQIRIAQGEPLSFESDIEPFGWAIECRINAEDAAHGFAPAPGVVSRYREPSGFGVRVDGAVGEGDAVLAQYDSLVAKLIAWGRSREEALSRMTRALADFQIEGPPTTIPLHRNLMAHPVFVKGQATTTFLADHADVLPIPSPASEPPASGSDVSPSLDLVVEVDGRRFTTTVHGLPAITTTSNPVLARKRAPASRSGPRAATQANGDDLASPIQGTVIRLAVQDGDVIEAGQVVCVIEAMKMENEVAAHKAGVLSSLAIDVGATVTVGQVIASIATP